MEMKMRCVILHVYMRIGALSKRGTEHSTTLVESNVRFVHVPQLVCMEDAVSYLCCIGTLEILTNGFVRSHVWNVIACLQHRSMNFLEPQIRMVDPGPMWKQQMYTIPTVVLTFASTSICVANAANVSHSGSRKAGCAQW